MHRITNFKPALSRIVVVEGCQIAFKCRHLGSQHRLTVCQPYKVDTVIKVGEERRYSKAFRARWNQCDSPVASLKSLTTSNHFFLSLRRWLYLPPECVVRVSIRTFLLISAQFAVGSFFFGSPIEVIVESNEMWQSKVRWCPKLHANLTAAFGNSH